MAELRCPRCGSQESARYRTPTVKDEVLLRRHRCLGCGRVYLTAQVAVDETLEQQLLDLFDK